MACNKLTLSAAIALLAFACFGVNGPVTAHENAEPRVIEGRLIAIGIPGVSAISVVGSFLPGGPVTRQPSASCVHRAGSGTRSDTAVGGQHIELW